MTASRRIRLPHGFALAALLTLSSLVPAHAQFQPPPPQTFDHDGWIAVEVKGVEVRGRDSTFEQRHQMPAGLSGGVTSFYWETYPTSSLTFQVETLSVFDRNDHFVKLDLFNPDGGFVRAGFRQTRHWYDDSGGFFPATGTWLTPWDDAMNLDVGVAWIEAGMVKPDIPSVTVRYTHRYRRGLKDSTVWGRSGLTGGAGNRGITPSFREIDESRHIVEGRATHTIGGTELGAGLRYEVSSQDNTLNSVQNFTEGSEEHITQSEGVKTDLFSTHAWVSTQLREKLRFSTSYLYTRIDNDITGDRILFQPETGTFSGYFLDMDGSTQMKQHVANANLVFTPREYFLVIPSIRFEKQETDSLVTHVRSGQQEVRSEREATNLSQRLELRYARIAKWRLFARGDWMQGDGDLRETPTNADDRVTDFDRRQQRYTLGANWNPDSIFSTSTQYYYSLRKNDYDHILPGRIGRHPAFIEKQDFETHGFNARVTSRPGSGITLVSRYDLQLTEIRSRGSRAEGAEQVSLAKIQSGDMERHIVSQAITWMPRDRLYLQASGSYVISRIETPANTITGEAWEDRVVESKNDYVNAGVAVLFAYDPKTDLDLTYSYYRAGNSEDNWASSVAYGKSEYEHGVRAGISRQVHDNLVWNGGYGFYMFRESTTGGNRDYDAHLLYTGLTLRF